MDQLKSIDNSPFKDSHSHSIHIGFLIIVSNAIDRHRLPLLWKFISEVTCSVSHFYSRIHHNWGILSVFSCNMPSDCGSDIKCFMFCILSDMSMSTLCLVHFCSLAIFQIRLVGPSTNSQAYQFENMNDICWWKKFSKLNYAKKEFCSLVCFLWLFKRQLILRKIKTSRKLNCSHLILRHV